MELLFRDAALALRALRRRPGLTAAALISLAVGLGAAIAVFRLIDAAFFRPLGVGRQEEVVSIYVARVERPDDFLPISYPNFEDLARQQQSLAAFAAYQWQRTILGEAEDVERLYIQFVSRDFFRALGVEPSQGRLWTSAEGAKASGAKVTVLSHDFWQRRLGGDPNVLGKTVRVSGESLTVVAVMPPRFKGTRTFTGAELWVPMGLYPQLSPYADDLEVRAAQMFELVGRLKPGVSLAQAELELQSLARGLASEYPEANRDQSLRVLPLTSASIEPWQRPQILQAAVMLASVVGVLLLIAWGNVASLLLAAGLEKRRELTIRLSMGASRWALVRQLLAESLLLSLAGGMLGLLLGTELPAVLWRFRPEELFSAAALDFTIDGTVLGVTLLLAVGTGLLFGLVPALRASRPRLVQALKEDSATVEVGSHRFALRELLVAGQIALCFVALAGAGLLLRSLDRAQRMNPGFAADQLMALTYSLPKASLGKPEGELLNERILDGLGSLPGVLDAAQATYQPLTAGPPIYWRVEDQGLATEEGRRLRLVMTNTVTPTYFATMGIALLEGRGFNSADRPGAPAVALVNEVMAKRMWQGLSPVGRKLTAVENGSELTIVGVVAASKHHSITEAPRWGLYLPFAQWPRPEVTVHLRTAGRPEDLVEPAQRRIRELAPALTPYNVRPMRRTIDASLWAMRLGSAVLGFIALLALVLAITGCYAVLSYSIRQRRRELGIRLALGARPEEVKRLVIRRSMLVVAAGIVSGLVVALASGRLMANLLFGVRASDPTTLGLMAVLLMFVAWLASSTAARQAAGIDPVGAMRSS